MVEGWAESSVWSNVANEAVLCPAMKFEGCILGAMEIQRSGDEIKKKYQFFSVKKLNL